MSWSITMVVVHGFALIWLVALLRNAPDFLQRLILVLLALSALGILTAHVIELLGLWTHWLVKRVPLELEHAAVLLYVFRLWFLERICPTLSRHSHSSRP